MELTVEADAQSWWKAGLLNEHKQDEKIDSYYIIYLLRYQAWDFFQAAS